MATKKTTKAKKTDVVDETVKDVVENVISDESKTLAETDEVETSTETVEVKTEETSKQRKIYVGVSLPGMKKNTVFEGKLPEVVDKPFIRELCIDIDDVSDFYKKKAVTGSREAFCYRKSAEYAKQITE